MRACLQLGSSAIPWVRGSAKNTSKPSVALGGATSELIHWASTGGSSALSKSSCKVFAGESSPLADAAPLAAQMTTHWLHAQFWALISVS